MLFRSDLLLLQDEDLKDAKGKYYGVFTRAVVRRKLWALHQYLQLGNIVTDTTKWMEVLRSVQQPRRQATATMTRSISVTQDGPSNTMDFDRQFQEQCVSSSLVPNHRAVPPSPLPVQPYNGLPNTLEYTTYESSSLQIRSGRAYNSGGNYNPAGPRATSLNTGNRVRGDSRHLCRFRTIARCFVCCVSLGGCIAFAVAIPLIMTSAEEQNNIRDVIIVPSPTAPPVRFRPAVPMPTISPGPCLRPVTNRPIASSTGKPVILL